MAAPEHGCVVCGIDMQLRPRDGSTACRADAAASRRGGWWPFEPRAGSARCRLGGGGAEAHRGIHSLVASGLFCAAHEKKALMCCNCGRDNGVPYFFGRVCAPCNGRRAASLAGGGGEGDGAPRHLVVLCHGLYGLPSELFAVRDKLRAVSGCLVHCCESYAGGGTKRGLDEIGSLIADEVRSVVDARAAEAGGPTLSTISFVGHSMGGVVARSAIGKLFNAADGTVACLKPLVYVSTASPHLGITNYGPLPQLPIALTAPLASIFAGRSGHDLFSIDTEDGVVRRLATEDHPLRALASFSSRRSYALKAGDMLVDFARSAFQTPGSFLRRNHRTYVAESTCSGSSPGSGERTCRVTFHESLPGEASVPTWPLNAPTWARPD